MGSGWSLWLADNANKKNTWVLLRTITDSISVPIVFFGDFNVILGEHEKEGGAMRSERRMDDFREVVDLCGLQDLGYRGNTFTWQSTHIQ